MRFLLVAALGFLACCRSTAPLRAIDSAAASCIPAGATVVAGVDLDRLRTSPLYGALPTSVTALLQPFRGARSLLLSYAGKELLVVASGNFAEAPAGTMRIAAGLVVAGSAEAMRAAAEQHGRGVSGSPELMADAESVAGGAQIWIVVRGDSALPLTGNAANVNRLLRNMEFAALTVRADSAIEFAIAAHGRTPDAARQFEETLRASITMAAAAEARQSELAALLRSIRVRREDRMVRAEFATDSGTAVKVFGLLAP